MRVFGLLSRRFFGFVPGWLALILVLGGTAFATAPVSHINIISDASQNQSGGSGYIGPAVVAQATSQPTMQPGNPYTVAYVIGDGQNGGIWNTCYSCTAGSFTHAHYHLIWNNLDGDTYGPDDIGIGPCALCNGDTSTIGSNIAIGGGALQDNTSGYQNVAVGRHALSTATTSISDVAIGINTLDGSGVVNSTTGSNDVAIGAQAGYAITSGNTDTFVGSAAGSSETTGGGNTFIGANAGQFQAGQTGNTLIGSSAGSHLQTGFITAIGFGALQADTSGNNNVGIGSSALHVLTTGSNNVAVGNAAGIAQTTANGNSFFGSNAGDSDTTGTDNAFFGYDAGYSTAGGSFQTFFGALAGKNSTGTGNSALGLQAGNGLTTGNYNTIIGGMDTAADENQITTGSNNAVLGYDANVPLPTASGQLSIQNAIYGAGNTGIHGTISTGCIAFYQTTCSAGTVAFAVPIVLPNGSATSCSGGSQFANGIMVISGAGAPTCTAPAASMYLRSDGASGSHIYISQGAGTWTAISGV